MTIRKATVGDIPALHTIRMAVKENVLTNPALVTEKDYADYLTTEGEGWLAELDGRIAGFAILRHRDHNVWALFVHPDYESKGVGKALQHTMLQAHFGRHEDPIWLSTGRRTRAEEFYRRTGWRAVGITTDGEAKYEMTLEDWNKAQVS